jgi:hypothetical protein
MMRCRPPVELEYWQPTLEVVAEADDPSGPGKIFNTDERIPLTMKGNRSQFSLAKASPD